MVKASGIGFDLEDEDEHLFVSLSRDGLACALPEVVPVRMILPDTLIHRPGQERGEEDTGAARDAILTFYEMRMAELHATCDDERDLRSLPPRSAERSVYTQMTDPSGMR